MPFHENTQCIFLEENQGLAINTYKEMV